MEGLSYATGAIAIGGDEQKKKYVSLKKIKPTSKSKKTEQKRISPNDMKGTKVMESGVVPSSILLRIEKATGLDKLQKKKLVQEIERYGVDAVADFAKSKAKSKVIDKALQGAHQWFERNTTVFMNRGLVAETTNGLEHTIEATPGPLTEMTRFGLTKGSPAIGGLMDYNSMRKKGSNVMDASVKATAHVGIGLESAEIGATIGSAVPGVGTIIGAAAGLVVGFGISKVADYGFDHLYDGIKGKLKRIGSGLKGHKGLGWI
ncbi:hypothetical protein FD35_GL002114 [Furfurilactobacillus rossiae DSM 15814]|uniref:Uncharacterized protein n=3 Tax=Furfurilactobacillus rossiae TaxID=231049 RepID=A0A0R1R4P6_9LACO|nr:hypothetical protein FD35_GL002114 [Furfurilactobacillus rossiae DSM 15814]